MPAWPPEPAVPELQPQLDAITAQTRTLVQPERLAVTDASVQELLATGIESRVLPVGAPAPEFALPAASPTSLDPGGQYAISAGRLVRSADLLALGPVIVTFFRGRWDPYCITELEAWQQAYPAVRARKALLVAVSPQTPRQNDFLVQQHGLSYPILSDAASQVAACFGLAYTVPVALQAHFRSILINIPFINGDKSWRLPLPGTFVLVPDSTGQPVIRFAQAFADHRVRPEPADVLASIPTL